jgi:hypothetical protein
MIELPDCSITEAHARGLRRAEDRWVEARQDRWNPLEQPRRFGPRVRAMHEDLLKVYGEGRVLQQRIGKKSVGWFCVEHDSAGRYTLTIRTLDRRPGLSRRGYGGLPLEATPHAYERFIQSMGQHRTGWVGLLSEVFDCLYRAPGYEMDDDRSSALAVRWLTHGFVKVGTSTGLAFVEVPDRGNAVLRTLVHAEALIGPNRLLWETLMKCDLKVRFIRESGTQRPDPFVTRSMM